MTWKWSPPPVRSVTSTSRAPGTPSGEALAAARSSDSTIPPGNTATMPRQMRRLLVGVTLAAALAPSQERRRCGGFNGVQAKKWAGRIAAVGQRPAGGAHEKQAGAIVRQRLTTLGYDVTTQRFPLPGHQVAERGRRTPGPDSRDHRRAHGRRPRNERRQRQRLRGRPHADARAVPADKNGVLVAAWAPRSAATRAGLPPRLAAPDRSLSRRRGRGPPCGLRRHGRRRDTLNIRGLESSPNRSARTLAGRCPRLGITASYRQDTGQSDHDEFVKVGVPAAWVEWRWDQCWHSPCDQIHRLKPYRLRAAGRGRPRGRARTSSASRT